MRSETFIHTHIHTHIELYTPTDDIVGVSGLPLVLSLLLFFLLLFCLRIQAIFRLVTNFAKHMIDSKKPEIIFSIKQSVFSRI